MDSKLFTSLLKEMAELHPDATLKDVSNYFEMCDKVGTIDEEAALYLRYHAWRDLSIDFDFWGKLILCFTWSNAKQGGSYWSKIHEELEGL